jgi:hypothetical protein
VAGQGERKMADNKKDFLSELAKEVDQKKHGERISIDSVDDYVPENKTRKATEYDRENDYPDETSAGTAKKPAEKPPVFKEPEESEKPEEPTEESEETETEDEYGEDGNPDSFDEEDRQKVVKPKVHIKKSWIILGVLAACGLGFLIWYLNFAPKIGSVK